MNTPLRALVVYESMFGNTETIARAVTDTLRLDGFAVEVHEVRDAPADAPGAVDLLVVGAPTHAFSLSRPSTRADAVQQGAPAGRADRGLREWLGTATGRAGLAVAVFDTRAAKARRLPMSGGRKAARLARQRGFTLLGTPVGFVVEDLKGPLAAHETERAARWAQSIAEVARAHIAAERAARDPSQ